MRNEALDAGQVTAIANVMAQVQAGGIDAKAGAALIGTAFPKLDKKMILEMFPAAKQEVQQAAQVMQQVNGAPAPANIQGAPNA
jgi:hypothetical protein